jgi:4-hydroxy-3-methylbut-2-enyl diphosphate reductase
MVDITIDPESGFCFGVRNAVTKATSELSDGQPLYSLGDMVHNPAEVKRLADMGLVVIDHQQFSEIHDAKVLFRAHGEPPESYSNLKDRNIKLIDATCPVVLRLQESIKKAYQSMAKCNGQVVIFGKKGHAEVVGLIGQTNGNAILVESEADLDKIDMTRPIEFFSQTTKDIGQFMKLVDALGRRASQFNWHDTICRQVANRGPHLKQFAAVHELIVFVGGHDSSNAKALFGMCKQVNNKSYFIENEDELVAEWFDGVESVGISGATSTPAWLIVNVKERIKQLVGQADCEENDLLA